MINWCIINASVLDGLATLPDESVQCVVTSPPYWGLRDYGTASWKGGDPECDHSISGWSDNLKPSVSRPDRNGEKRKACIKCGARRIDSQLGLEPIPDCLGWATGQPCGECYVCHMVEVFSEVKRVLRDDGTCWLNLGDSYASVRSRYSQHGHSISKSTTCKDAAAIETRKPEIRLAGGYKDKDMLLMPARVALALQAAGWWVRSDVIWHKTTTMPESVKDRPTKSYEHIFLMTKAQRYYYDQDAYRTPLEASSIKRSQYGWGGTVIDERQLRSSPEHTDRLGERFVHPSGSNLRDVWSFAVGSYNGAHFATFPLELPERCIKLGTSELGECSHCGKPWVRVVEHEKMRFRQSAPGRLSRQNINRTMTSDTMEAPPSSVTVGWQPSCSCNSGEPIPQTVLDPFAGAGTTLLMANRLGRNSIGIELNPEYVKIASERIAANVGLSPEKASELEIEAPAQLTYL